MNLHSSYTFFLLTAYKCLENLALVKEANSNPTLYILKYGFYNSSKEKLSERKREN